MTDSGRGNISWCRNLTVKACVVCVIVLDSQTSAFPSFIIKQTDKYRLHYHIKYNERNFDLQKGMKQTVFLTLILLNKSSDYFF